MGLGFTNLQVSGKETSSPKSNLQCIKPVWNGSSIGLRFIQLLLMTRMGHEETGRQDQQSEHENIRTDVKT